MSIMFLRSSFLCFLLAIEKAVGDITYTSPPPFGGNCWSSMQQLNFWELGLLQPGHDLNEKRIYNICSNSVTQIGVRSAPDSAEFVGGDMPIVVINPNVNILCGETGESSNNCSLTGGEFQFAAFNPEGLVPAGFIPNVTNLFVSGLTFTNFGSRGTSSTQITVPGQDIVFTDCIWKNSNATNPPGSAFQVKYVESNEDANGTNAPWATATVQQSLFENIDVAVAVINVNNRCENCTGVVDYGRIDVSVEECTFRSNRGLSTDNPLSIIDYGLNSTGLVDSCCFYNNTSPGAVIAWSGDEQTVTATTNFGQGNTVMLTDDLGNACDIATFSEQGGNMTCVNFDSNVCESPLFTDMPSSSPTATIAPSKMPTPGATPQPTTSSASLVTSHLIPVILPTALVTVSFMIV